MKLFEQFAHRGYHSCVMTTFGIDFSAFENIVLHRLRGAGCNNNLVIVDAGMLAHTLENAIELPCHAGRQYTVAGLRSKGVFHPKVILQLGRKTGRLFVSSANLTAPGLAGNLEVIGQIAASPGNSGESRLLAAAWRYLERFLDLEQEAIAYQVARIRKQASWLMDVAPAEGIVSLANGEEAAFLDGTSKRTIASRFAAFLGGVPVSRLIVVSPYWDEDLEALRDLQEATGARQVSILVGGYRPSFPTHALVGSDPIRLFPLGMGEARFVHAKVVIAQTRDSDHVLYGSANCTVAGVGASRTFAGRNEEACLYRRMKSGAAIRELNLEAAIVKEKVLKGEDLPKWQVRPEVPLDATISRDPGRFEVRGEQLLWWPTGAYAQPDARIELLGRTGDVLSVDLVPDGVPTEGSRRFMIGALPEPAHFVRIRVGLDVSMAAVIVMPEVLRQETREARTRQLEEVATRLQGRDRLGTWIMEIIDLIEQAEAFETQPHHTRFEAATREHGGSRSISALSSRTLNYDAFIAGRKLQGHRRPIFHRAFAGSDLDLVRSYLNRMLGLDAAPAKQADPDEDSRIREALAVHDEAVTDGDDDGDGLNATSQLTQGELSKARQKQLEEEQARNAIAARLAARADIAKFSIKFCSQMRARPTDRTVVLQDMLRLRAILMMMLSASCPIGSGLLDKRIQEWQVLRPDGENAWARLIGRVLSTFFNGTEPLIARLQLQKYDDALPIELVECFVTCFWAIQACRIAAEAKQSMQGLGQQLTKLSATIYRRSGMTPAECEADAIKALFEKMTSTFTLGFSPETILGLHRKSSVQRPASEPNHSSDAHNVTRLSGR